MQFLENEDGFLGHLRDVIADNLSNPNFGVAELAETLPMHRSSLSRKLSELIGLSPSELIEDMRMEEAMQLLTVSDIPIGQVANEVGFTELSNFSRAFKRHFGESPSNVRNGLF